MKEERMHLRDIETKKVKKYFSSPNAAHIYHMGMRFGLHHYYEVYDSQLQRVVSDNNHSIKYLRRNRNK